MWQTVDRDAWRLGADQALREHSASERRLVPRQCNALRSGIPTPRTYANCAPPARVLPTALKPSSKSCGRRREVFTLERSS